MQPFELNNYLGVLIVLKLFGAFFLILAVKALYGAYLKFEENTWKRD